MLDQDSTVAPREGRYDGPLRAYERYRTRDPAQASALAAGVLSANQLVVPGHDRRFEATCRAVRVHSASLLYLTYGTDVVVDRVVADRIKASRRDHLAILFPVHGGLRLRTQGREFDVLAGETAGVTSSRDTMHARLGAQVSVLTLRVDLHAVAAALGNLLLEPPPTDLTLRSGPVAGPAHSSLAGTAELLAASYDRKDPGSPLPPVVARRIEEQILCTVLLSVNHNYRARLLGEEPRPGRRTVREAIDLVRAEDQADWTIPELARAVGVTVRALEMGFRKELGRTPREFVREQRLLRAHDELLRANPGDGTTVTEVASRWGFWHAGRFAAGYSGRFGVRPATTLRSVGGPGVR
ncbi:AraC family transcriptional regulator [Streptomyces sp. NRRL F-5126]|uniref:AraC family transcriptional regulator n=1 Tax=Streptomyces sp. NRRL F-5126 TaxID=1463857 RepID=UPI00068C244A|nr:AraC family transcriptional regulator [Streptomyces sp. NRRL F-5126]